MIQIEFLESLEFIRQGGAISIGVAVILVFMSVGSWTIMVVKSIQARRLRYASSRFLPRFWTNLSTNPYSNAISEAEISLHEPRDDHSPNTNFWELLQSSIANPHDTITQHRDNPFVRIATQGFHAVGHRYRKAEQQAPRNTDELIANALRRAIDQEAVQLEHGLTLLASIGSLAPFVGLFGTVCGIYHALGALAVGGQATVDKVAGPVGEALIMTAFGLAVALPAVLAYNSLLRDNRLLILKMENFAQDLYIYLTTGIPSSHSEPNQTHPKETTKAEALSQ